MKVAAVMKQDIELVARFREVVQDHSTNGRTFRCLPSLAAAALVENILQLILLRPGAVNACISERGIRIGDRICESCTRMQAHA
jgi:hypothetical protein